MREDEGELAGEVSEVCRVVERLALRKKGVAAVGKTVDGAAEEAPAQSVKREENKDTSTLVATAELEARLSALEGLLGLTTIQASTTASSLTPVLPLLTKLSTQVQILTNTSTPVLEAASRKIKTLVNDSEKLQEAQKRSRAVESSILSSSVGTPTESGTVQPSPLLLQEKEKINALFGTLNTIDTLSPLLPGVLDRLRTLRAIHANAGEASKRLEEVEKKVDGMDGEILKWKEVLEKAEEIVKEAEGRIEKNAEVVEGWVKGVEEKVERLNAES